MTTLRHHRHLRHRLVPAGALLSRAFGVFILTLFVASGVGASVAPVTSVTARDHRYDAGGAVDVFWSLSPDDVVGGGDVSQYQIFRSIKDSPFVFIAATLPAETSYFDQSVIVGQSYRYRIDTRAQDTMNVALGVESAVVVPEVEYFNGNRTYALIFMFIVCGAVLYYINRAKRGDKFFIRKIAGLEAIDEAIGRATEMGRPLLFVPGIQDMDDVQTIAAITILGKVAAAVAEYETKAIVPARASLVMTAARETVKEAYATAGRPDSYLEDNIFYLTDEQFGFVAGVNGIMVREKPATCFYIGAFFAESLILAETGNSIGAIQIAGTAQPPQLPFFVAACDYTLIGEELFAASAYLSGEPRQLGSLKGQDAGKVIAMTAIVIGVVVATLTDGFGITALAPVKHWLFTLFNSATE